MPAFDEKAEFRRCLNRVLPYEGGYSNHPHDPGGVTLNGVTQRVNDSWRRNNGLEARPLTPSLEKKLEWTRERDAIYYEQYWKRVRGDLLPAGVNLAVFDGAVNSGPGQSIKWLQAALGVAPDGVMGEHTVEALNECTDHDRLVAAICERRMAFLQRLKTWGTFGKGWSRRVSHVLATGQAWAAGSIGPKPIVTGEGANAKADAGSLATAPVRPGVAASATTGGTVLTGAADQVQQATVALTPLADTLTIVKYIVLAGTIIGAGILLFGIYRDWRAQRVKNGEDTAFVPEYAA
jgi:lysozyme family protein